MSPRVRLVVAFTSTLLIAYIAVGSLLGRVFGDSTYAQLSIFNEVVRLVIDAYVDRVDVDRAMAGARLGMTEALDGDSAYLDDEEFRLLQQPAREDADVGLLLSRRFGLLMVVSVRPGSPAEKAKVQAGDLVKQIEGKHTHTIAAPVAQRMLRGAPGSLVKMTLLHLGNDPVDLSLARERLQPQAAKGKMLEAGIGYLKVPEAEARSVDEARGELDSLKRAGAESLVLDLRGNGSGPLAEGVKLAELFMKGGVVAKRGGAHVSEEVLSADPKRTAWNGKLVVLIDLGTAGAAEIAAAGLLDSDRATLVGTRTFGRTPEQKMVALPEGGLVLTVARYSSPKGTLIHTRGVEATVKVDLPDEDDADELKGRDLFLEKALETLKAEGVKKAA
jgi:carboxyl-terminal processing protease